MHELTDLATYTSLNPSQLADTVLYCPACGRDHRIPFQNVMVDEDVIVQIPSVIASILGHDSKRVGIIYDREIEEKLENLFFKPFGKLNLLFQRISLAADSGILEAGVNVGEVAVKQVSGDVDFLIGVGSGVISDLTKWIATKCRLPFLLIGTAASMNAYTSITASMMEENVKTSKWLDPAAAVLLDPKLLASAPAEMTCAGIGDLLARHVANADWKLSALIRGTYFCSVPFEMMTSFQDAYLTDLENIKINDPDAIIKLGMAVLVSGYTMTILDGETSPSSGSEHILSHFFDFQHEIFGSPKHLHGVQVGLGTIIMSAAYDLLRQINPSDFDVDVLERKRLSQTAIYMDHQWVFGVHGSVFDEIVRQKRVDDVAYRSYISEIISRWDAMMSAVGYYLLPAEVIRGQLEKAGAVTTLAGVGRNEEDAIQALLYGSHYRKRYTVLDLFWELGLFPSMAQNILEHAGVL